MKKHNISIQESILIAVVLLPIIGCVLFVGLMRLTNIIDVVMWKKSTSPLSTEVVLDVCQKLGILETESVCNSTNVYANELYPVVLENFQIGESSFSDVSLVLEEYEYDSSKGGPLGDGTFYFDVSYDLQGDRKSVIVLIFDQGTQLLNRKLTGYEGVQ